MTRVCSVPSVWLFEWSYEGLRSYVVVVVVEGDLYERFTSEEVASET
jgi:hypothetical protein